MLLSNRSVHNVRIERLWVDITAQIGASWSNAFTSLELHYGLDINSPHHLWLLHHLFLHILNQHLSFFAEAWNHHRIQIRDGPNRSPADMFGFDMLVHGIRGDRLYDDDLTADELEVYGVDWAALNDDHIVRSVQTSAPQNDGAASWIGRTGPPDNLNEVSLFSPTAPGTDSDDFTGFDTAMALWMETAGDTSISAIWVYGLALARNIYGNVF